MSDKKLKKPKEPRKPYFKPPAPVKPDQLIPKKILIEIKELKGAICESYIEHDYDNHYDECEVKLGYVKIDASVLEKINNAIANTAKKLGKQVSDFSIIIGDSIQVEYTTTIIDPDYEKKMNVYQESYKKYEEQVEKYQVELEVYYKKYAKWKKDFAAYQEQQLHVEYEATKNRLAKIEKRLDKGDKDARNK